MTCLTSERLISQSELLKNCSLKFEDIWPRQLWLKRANHTALAKKLSHPQLSETNIETGSVSTVNRYSLLHHLVFRCKVNILSQMSEIPEHLYIAESTVQPYVYDSWRNRVHSSAQRNGKANHCGSGTDSKNRRRDLVSRTVKLGTWYLKSGWHSGRCSFWIKKSKTKQSSLVWAWTQMWAFYLHLLSLISACY